MSLGVCFQIGVSHVMSTCFGLTAPNEGQVNELNTFNNGRPMYSDCHLSRFLYLRNASGVVLCQRSVELTTKCTKETFIATACNWSPVALCNPFDLSTSWVAYNGGWTLHLSMPDVHHYTRESFPFTVAVISKYLQRVEAGDKVVIRAQEMVCPVMYE